jgi:hypothetical protein
MMLAWETPKASQKPATKVREKTTFSPGTFNAEKALKSRFKVRVSLVAVCKAIRSGAEELLPQRPFLL